MSLRDQIFAADDILTETVWIPEWNVTIEVRGMTGADRTRILEQAVDPTNGGVNLKFVYPQIVMASCFDPTTGERVFDENDADALLSKSAQALDRLAEVGMRLGGFTKESAEDAGKRFPETAGA